MVRQVTLCATYLSRSALITGFRVSVGLCDDIEGRCRSCRPNVCVGSFGFKPKPLCRRMDKPGMAPSMFRKERDKATEGQKRGTEGQKRGTEGQKRGTETKKKPYKRRAEERGKGELAGGRGRGEGVGEEGASSQSLGGGFMAMFLRLPNELVTV